MAKKILFIFLLLPVMTALAGKKGLTVKEALRNVKVIAYPAYGRMVDRTVAEALKEELIPQAELLAEKNRSSIKKEGVMRVAIADEDFAQGPEKTGLLSLSTKDWMFFIIKASGEADLLSSKPHLLYALFSKIKSDWLGEDISKLEKGKILETTFTWLEGNDNYFASRNMFASLFDPEKTIKELARLGCSHVAVNALASPLAAEQGPPGEIYYRFYVSSPDLDQFVETELNKGSYSPEYLQANLKLLKENAALAIKYGLTPGLNICTPRSVPEGLLEKYPFLRGGRVDHPFRSYRPRFTLTLAHPVVRWHYAEMMKKIMAEVPELGYVFIWTNDSGSGFEYTSSLYCGRNGGAYLVREWKSSEEIARVAGENVLRYFRLLHDTASGINPCFRVITNLFSFTAEEKILLEGLSDRIDLKISPSELDKSERAKKLRSLPQKRSYLLSEAKLAGNYILGVPFPWLCHEQLQTMIQAGFDRAIALLDPASLAPHNINHQVLQAVQTDRAADIDVLIQKTADKWVGQKLAPTLIKAWRLTDEAVRAFPDVPLYGNNNWAFPWYRLWVRPIVPDIEKIPEEDRAYYEKYMTATFNNPTMVDLAKDALWTLITREQAEKIVAQCDREIWKRLDEAIQLLKNAPSSAKDKEAQEVFTDQRERLAGLLCYFRTLRNTAAWVAGVYGYLEAKDASEKESFLEMVREMAEDEIQNSQDLLALAQNSKTTFMPISSVGETFNMYGENFIELVKRKIELMEAHKNDEPRINPDFIWRMPSGFRVSPKEYLKY